MKSKDILFTKSYVCILMANFLLFFGFWLLIPVLPFYLEETYACPEAALGAILSCYTVSELCVRPFSGYLMDSFPRKPLYLLCYLAGTAMFLGYMLSATLTMFILLRTLHGVAFGGVTVGGNTLVVDIMPSSRRGEGLGYYGLTNNIAMALGPTAGLMMHSHVSYQNIFMTGMAASVTGLLLAMMVKTGVKPQVKRPPLSLDRFVLLKGLPVSLSLLLLSIPYGATTNFVAMYAREINLDVPTGLFFIIMAAGMGISRIFAGKQVDRGLVTQCIRTGLLPVILAFAILGLCGRLAHLNTHLATGAFFTVPMLLGVGFGIIFPAMNTLYINLAPNNRRATATSTYLTAWDVGIGLGIVTSGVIAQQSSFATVYLVGAGLSAISLAFFMAKVTPHYNKNKVR